MNYKRLYTFGCSFTNFYWPTWADIIAFDTQLPYENWGLCGSGNVGIGHRMVECDIKNNFTEDDLVLVLWSTWHREDRYISNHWGPYGNIFNDSVMYDQKFREKYWDPDNDIIKNVGMQYLIKKSFPVTHEAVITEQNALTYRDRKLYNFYEPHTTKNVFPWEPGSINFEGALKHIDNHPDIEAHLNYVENHVYPVIGLELKEETKKYFMRIQEHVVGLGKSGLTKKIKSWNDLVSFFEENLDHSMKHKGH